MEINEISLLVISWCAQGLLLVKIAELVLTFIGVSFDDRDDDNKF